MRHATWMVGLLVLLGGAVSLVSGADKPRGYTVPYWEGKEDGQSPAEHKDRFKNTWTAFAVGSSNAIQSPKAWKPMKWNAEASRWEREGVMHDQAPSYSEKGLRGRGSEGLLTGMMFEPGFPARFEVLGKAKVDTWTPDGPCRVVVQVFRKKGTFDVLLDQEFDDGTTINWDDYEKLKVIDLKRGDRLMFTFAPTNAQTGTLRFTDGKTPTTIARLRR